MSALLRLSIVLLALAAHGALAQQPLAPTADEPPAPRAEEPPAPSAEQPPAPSAEQRPPAVDPAPLQFDLLPPQAPVDEAKATVARGVMKDLARRRALLDAHQIAGYATVGTLAATVVLGQLNYMDRYGGRGDTGKYRTAHSIAAYGSTAIFAATGLLALLAPSPLEKPGRFDTATLHKVSMAIATAGFVTQIVLGIATRKSEGNIRQRDLALAHQIVGYTTLGATTLGFAVLLF